MRNERRFFVSVFTLALAAVTVLSSHAQQAAAPLAQAVREATDTFPQLQLASYLEQKTQQEGNRQQDYYRGEDRQNRGDDSALAGASDLDRRAFRDGMDAARSDWQAQRTLDVRRTQMYRRPPAQRNLRDQYRNSFTRGYQAAIQHRQQEQYSDQNRDPNRDQNRDHDRDHDRNNPQQSYAQQPYPQQPR